MRASLKTVLLAAAGVMALSWSAAAAERQLRVETVDLWSWRGTPAVPEMVPAGTVHASASGPAMQAMPMAMAPDASASPLPETDSSQMLSTPMIPVRPEAPETVKTAWGCVVGGTVGTGVTLAAGAENLINVIAGGLVAPASPAVLAIGLAGVVFGTFCTMGQALTPIYVHYFEKTKDADTPAAPKELAQSLHRGPESRPADVVVSFSATR